VTYLTRALEGDPNNTDAMGTLASTLDELGRHTEADSMYARALRLVPDNATLLNNYSYSLSERGARLGEALDMVKRALEKEPKNGAFLDTIGWIYYKMGDYELALKYILQAIETRDSSAEVMEHLGDVYDKLGQPENAQKYWQKALDLDRTRKSVQEKLGLTKE
jgi:Tfp pilus assembly protein PilF